jgi:hypothetical protein
MISVYRCVPKSGHNISPQNAWINGCNDNVGGALSTTNLLSYPTDSREFVDLWRIQASKKCTLQPGQEIKDSYMNKPFYYEPAVYDSESNSFEPRDKSVVWLVVVRGVIGHDISAAERGILAAGVDCEYNTTIKIKYQGGQSFTNYVYEDNSVSTFTNGGASGGVVSSMPVSDNIGYSVA